VAKGLTQAVACAGGLVCSYTDTGSSSTSTYTIEIGDYAGNLVFCQVLVSVNKSVRVDAEVNNPVGAGLYGNATPGGEPVLDYGTASRRLHDLPGEHDGTRRQRSAESVGHGADRRRIGGRWAAAQQGRLNFSSTPFTGCSRTTS